MSAAGSLNFPEGAILEGSRKSRLSRHFAISPVVSNLISYRASRELVLKLTDENRRLLLRVNRVDRRVQDDSKMAESDP